MIKKGDKVKIITGASKGKTGNVLSVFPKENKILVEGINLKKKNTKPKRDGEKGQVIEKAYPIHVSNVVKV